MAKIKNSRNKEETIEEVEVKEEVVEVDKVVIPKVEQFDPSLPESKQRHLR